MAMTAGNQKAAINVTPMIDVLLVLLIIFMVVIHTDSEGLDAKVPKPQSSSDAVQPNLDDIVLLVQRDLSITINKEPVDQRNLESRLAQVYKTRGNHVIFVGGSADLTFEPILHVMDVARGVGLTRIALLPKNSL